MLPASALRGQVSHLASPCIGVFLGEDGIVVELLADLVLQFESGQLKQPNRLLELGCHHQLLGQAELLLQFHAKSRITGTLSSRTPV
jgi:hypothetical protein